MFRARIISELAQLCALTPEWRALYRESRACFVMSPTWQLAWWRAMGDAPSQPFGDRRKIVAVEVRNEAGELRGLATFAARWLTVAAVPRLRLDAFGSGEPRREEVCSEYLTVLACEGEHAQVAAAVAGALLEVPMRWHELLLPAMRGDDPMLDPLVRSFVGAGCDVTLRPAGASEYAILPSTFEAYLASLSKKYRYFVRRTMSDFEAWAGPGGWSFERARSAAELGPALEVFTRLHEARWGSQHVFARERFREFHQEVTREMIEDTDGTLDLWCLTAHGRPVAAIYNIVSSGRVYHYQAGRITDVPPGVKLGIVANVLAIQRAIASGHREYDFLPGDAMYKRQLGQRSHRLLTLRVGRPDPSSIALDLLSNVLRSAGGQLAKRVPATTRYVPGLAPVSTRQPPQDDG